MQKLVIVFVELSPNYNETDTFSSGITVLHDEATSCTGILVSPVETWLHAGSLVSSIVPSIMDHNAEFLTEQITSQRIVDGVRKWLEAHDFIWTFGIFLLIVLTLICIWLDDFYCCILYSSTHSLSFLNTYLRFIPSDHLTNYYYHDYDARPYIDT